MPFRGFVRQDGSVGTRNKVAVIYTVECARVIAERIAETDPEAQVIGFGSCYSNNWAYRRLSALATHSNVIGSVLVSLGCESTDFRALHDWIEAQGQRVESVVIQGNGGTIGAIEKGRAAVQRLSASASTKTRTSIPHSRLVVGVAADTDSTAAGVIGKAIDRLVSDGVSVVFPSQVLAGTSADVIQRRSADRATASSLKEGALRTERLAKDLGVQQVGSSRRSGSGAPLIVGESPFNGHLEPWGQPSGPGVYFVDHGSHLDGSILSHFEESSSDAIMATAACGAQVVLHLADKVRIEASALAPVLRICGDQESYDMMPDDFDLGGSALTPQMVVDQLIAVASGEETAGEDLGNLRYDFGYKH